VLFLNIQLKVYGARSCAGYAELLSLSLLVQCEFVLKEENGLLGGHEDKGLYIHSNYKGNH